MPDTQGLSRRPGLTVGDLRDGFVAANPGLRGEMIGVKTNPGGWLREVSLCYSASLKAVDCPRQQLGARDQTPLRIGNGGKNDGGGKLSESGWANRRYEASGTLRESR